jgi:hypothetical protein
MNALERPEVAEFLAPRAAHRSGQPVQGAREGVLGLGVKRITAYGCVG